MNEQAMSDITEEKGILHCQKGYKYATLKKKKKHKVIDQAQSGLWHQYR